MGYSGKNYKIVNGYIQGISRRTIDRLIKQLNEEGVIDRIGYSRSGYWKLHE